MLSWRGRFKNIGCYTSTFIDCSAGTFWEADNGTCTECAANTFSTSGATACTVCPDTSTSEPGSEICGKYTDQTAGYFRSPLWRRDYIITKSNCI